MLTPPPRLSVLLASDAPVGIVFRRGPSKLVRVFHWDREKDKFKPSARFNGRIFDWNSDLSPNGRYMIYFAMGGAEWAIPETSGTWTAISRVPTLTAIALWGQDGGTRGGGEMFTSNRSYWLDVDSNPFPIRDTTELRRDSKHPATSHEEHRGWIWTNNHREDGSVVDLPAWEWADWGRHWLVWAEKGCLKAAKLGAHKLGTVRTLHDFNHPEHNQ